MFLANQILAQSTGDYRSKATGNWGDAATWQTYDGADWVDAVGSPDATSGTITIQASHTVTVAVTLTVNGAAIVVNGTLKNTAGITLTTGSFLYNNGGVYEHALNASSIPVSTWGVGSTCLVTGINSTSAPTGLNQSFYHFIWNCPSQGGNVNFNANLTTVNGNLSISNTNSFQLRFGSAALTVNIAGDVIINGSTVIFTTTGSSGTYTINVNIGGDIILSAGALYLENTSSVTANWNLTGDFIMSGGTLGRQGSGTGNLIFLSGSHLFNKTGGTITSNNGGPIFIVNSGASLDLGVSVINDGPFTLNTGASLICGHADGLNGNLTTTRVKTLSTGANYTFNGGVAQVTGALLPATVNNLTINNASGVSLSSGVTVNGAFTLTTGKLTTTSGNLLTIGAGGSITGGSASSFVNGPMAHTVAASVETNKIFPIGKGSAYRPLELTVTQDAVTSTTYTAEQFNTAPPVRLFLGTLDKVSTVRYYTVTKGAGANVTAATIKLSYDSDDGVTHNNDLRIAKDDGAGNWSDLGGTGTANTTGTITSTNPFTNFSDFVLANVLGGGNALPVELTSFAGSIRGRVVTLNWGTATEKDNYGFEVERKVLNKNEWTKIGFVQGSGNSNSTKEYSFADKTSKQNGTYVYRLKQIDNDGTISYSNEIEIAVNIPATYSVSQNYPNPFNPSTRIEYQIPVSNYVTIKLYDVLGNFITTLVNENKEAGVYTLDFDAKHLSNGVYFYQIRAGEFVQTKKMTLMK